MEDRLEPMDTMSQLSLLGPLANLEAAEAGFLVWARGYARTVALTTGSVSSDDIRQECDRVGLQPNSPHAFGAIFKEQGWRVVSREPSRYASNNQRWICRWRWEDV